MYYLGFSRNGWTKGALAYQDEINQRLGLTSKKQALEDLRDANIQVTEPKTAPDSSEVNDDRSGSEAPPKTAKVKDLLAQTGSDHESRSADVKEAIAEDEIKQAKVKDLEVPGISQPCLQQPELQPAVKIENRHAPHERSAQPSGQPQEMLYGNH